MGRARAAGRGAKQESGRGAGRNARRSTRRAARARRGRVIAGSRCAGDSAKRGALAAAATNRRQCGAAANVALAPPQRKRSPASRQTPYPDSQPETSPGCKQTLRSVVFLDDDRLAVVMVVMMVMDNHDRIGIGGSCKGNDQSERGESGKSKHKSTHSDPPNGCFLAQQQFSKARSVPGRVLNGYSDWRAVIHSCYATGTIATPLQYFEPPPRRKKKAWR